MINLFIKKLFSLSRLSKIIIQVLSDFLLILGSFVLSIYLRLEDISYFNDNYVILLIIITELSSLILFFRLKFYNKIIRYISDKIILNLSLGVFGSCIFLYLFSEIIDVFLPRSIPFIYFAILSIAMISVRFILKNLFLIYKYDNRSPIAIYGAGELGRLVLSNLQGNLEYEPIIFIDDDITLSNSEIDNIKVLTFEKSIELIKSKNIKTVLFAISNISIENKKIIFNKLEKQDVRVKIFPDIQNFNDKKIDINQFSNISIEEILQREEIPPIPKLLNKNIYKKTVLITGCGGSIGSELCRQILRISPSKIICLDNSEFALYKISEELKKIKKFLKSKVLLQFELCSIIDSHLLELIFNENKIDTIYHAAAYKQVPLVEENVISAVKNNVFGTQNLVRLSYKYSIKNFTLISSDKAVRPTNIMGATKRIAELICLSLYNSQQNTKFSIVRFGNVIGSSGSVIPLFENQIKDGGPLTITHKKIERYFMTINEAVGLVIQSSAMSEGKDIFVLDMGKPVKIIDLAFRMVKLMGFEPTIFKRKSEKNSKFILIKFIGLRAGEKLYEELFLDNQSIKTSHPRIFKTYETFTEKKQLSLILTTLTKFVEKKDILKIKKCLNKKPIFYKNRNQ